MKNGVVRDALAWIRQILDTAEVPYQIVGGMAAWLHGGTRPIHDIDMYIPADKGAVVYSLVREFVSKPLKRYQEAEWDIEYFQLLYNGQKIEIGVSPGAKFLNRATGEWIEQTIDFNRSDTLNFEGYDVLVMLKEELIRYKTILNREVDRIDIEDLAD